MNPKVQSLLPYLENPNTRGMLNAIRYAEGTAGDNGYSVTFGYEPFDNSKGHPARVVRKGGYASDAAGAYQFLSTTDRAVGERLGIGNAFDPVAQDLKALQYVQDRGVSLSDVAARGLQPEHVFKLSGAWASFPKDAGGASAYGQPSKPLDKILAVARGQTSAPRLAGTGRSAAPAATTAPVPAASAAPGFPAPEPINWLGRLAAPGGTAAPAQTTPQPQQRIAGGGDRMLGIIGALTPELLPAVGAAPASAPATPAASAAPAIPQQQAQGKGTPTFGIDPVVSVRHENKSGQPGTDLYFEDPRTKKAGLFPAALPGVVTGVENQPGGYGNYVTVKSQDPFTGKPVAAVYAHLDPSDIRVRPGDQVLPGQVIARQGGSGNVESADGTIASLDFFADVTPGTKDMTPHPNYERLRQLAARFYTGRAS